jgi:hypothetical protein
VTPRYILRCLYACKFADIKLQVTHILYGKSLDNLLKHEPLFGARMKYVRETLGYTLFDMERAIIAYKNSGQDKSTVEHWYNKIRGWEKLKTAPEKINETLVYGIIYNKIVNNGQHLDGCMIAYGKTLIDLSSNWEQYSLKQYIQLMGISVLINTDGSDNDVNVDDDYLAKLFVLSRLKLTKEHRWREISELLYMYNDKSNAHLFTMMNYNWRVFSGKDALDLSL